MPWVSNALLAFLGSDQDPTMASHLHSRGHESIDPASDEEHEPQEVLAHSSGSTTTPIL